MGRYIDMTGQKFGRLTVLGESGNRDPLGNVLWNCMCDCGKAHTTNGIGLRHGRVRSCGCLQRDVAKTLPITQPEPLIDRFNRNTNMAGPDECWEWIGPRNEQGYGKVRYNGRGSLAHRMSYEIHKGPIADGMHVLHSCDNPKCVNPAHLRQGTHRENMDEMVQKKRYKVRHGIQHHAAKMTPAKVREMRLLFGSVSLLKLAKQFGLNKKTVLSIKQGKTWKEVV